MISSSHPHQYHQSSNCDDYLEQEDLDEDEIEEIDVRFLEVCVDGDVEDLVQLFENLARNGETLGPEDLNCSDNSGRTAVSYLCANGMVEMLEVIEDLTDDIDYNLPDNEGNTPLHYAAQAGHVEIVSHLLTKVRTILVDPINHQGFTPLMKAALQGRIKCSKLLLFSGASAVRRDFGRGFTASQWARFCGRYMCAESIEKFVRSAVPGSVAIQSDSNGSLTSLGSKKTKKASPAHHSSRIRSRSSGSSGQKAGSSWLTRTLKKAFNSSSDSENYVDSSSELTVTKRKSSFKLTGFRSSSKRSTRPSNRQIVIPQVEVTLTSNDMPSTASAAIGEANEVQVPIVEAANSSPEKNANSKHQQQKKSYSFLTKKFTSSSAI